MSAPIVLPVNGIPLYRQVLNKLASDTDPASGLVAALGARMPDDGSAAASGIYSLYPNYTTGGPNAEPDKCPRPFVIGYDGGARAVDKQGRELRVFLEIHDDPDAGDQRIPGIIARVFTILLTQEWRPTSDSEVRYISGLSFESRSPALPDKRYNTQVVQVSLVCTRAQDRTSSRGYNG